MDEVAEMEMAARTGSAWPPGGDPEMAGGILSPTDRDRILQAMTECCAERGYRETTVKEVTDRAQVRLETFETLFADKEECAVAATNRVASEVLATVSTVGSGERSELERGLAGVKGILALMAARPSYAGLGYIQARQGGTERMHEAYESGVRVLTVMIERIGRLVGGEAARPSQTTRAALGGAEAVVRREIAAGRTERLPQLLPELLYSVLVPFVGQEEALRQARMIERHLGKEG
jgi:AcrR family transcriptional regulator